jgi:hypothetical protein
MAGLDPAILLGAGGAKIKIGHNGTW